MEKQKHYSYRDVDMLTAAKSISKSFSAYLPELGSARSDWTTEYAAGLQIKIDKAIETQLGIDPKKELRNASSVVNALLIPAKRDLSFFKTQINDDFKNEKEKRDEIIKILGFKKNHKDVNKGKHQALVMLLYAFKTNMTDSLRKEITAKGLNDSLINTIIGYADTFKSANVTKENFKETTKVVTQDVADSFNKIYEEIIGLCKKVSSFYRNEPLKKEQFSFRKVVDNISASRKQTEKPVEEKKGEEPVK